MSDEQRKVLEQQLWNIANTLRGKMDADEFRDYILGFIFYKYLSEKIELFANDLLKADGKKYNDLDDKKDEKIVRAIENEAIDGLGYFLKPSELFHSLVKREQESTNLIADLE